MASTHRDDAEPPSPGWVLPPPAPVQARSALARGRRAGAAPGRSPVQQVSCLFAEMVRHGLRCIAFCKTRKLCEQVLVRTREILEETEEAELVDTICVYHGGYVAADRRRIEADLFGGRLHGVAATNALELGIDIGNMDAMLHLEFPGSMASLVHLISQRGCED